jgi:hypothetical protein
MELLLANAYLLGLVLWVITPALKRPRESFRPDQADLASQPLEG